MYIIGIAGGNGSGKTTVVRKIVESLTTEDVALIPQDSYYNDTSEMTIEERHKINFDHPSAFDWQLLIQHIKDLKNGVAIEQPTYSYIECNRQAETIHIEPHKVIIIETKGEGYAAKFSERKEFMKSFIQKNNEKFGYPRFDFLYLEDTISKEEREKQMIDKINEFFND